MDDDFHKQKQGCREWQHCILQDLGGMSGSAGFPTGDLIHLLKQLEFIYMNVEYSKVLPMHITVQQFCSLLNAPQLLYSLFGGISRC